ncbi:MAG: hypothetical protein JWR27_1177 [Aeromicrobium sp.]|jgi:hypothetical protein|nr:hypothetical protein [Aeromicrobium sp.]
MSRTALTDGSVRYSPNLAHRSKRKISAGQYLVPLGVCGSVGLASAHRLGAGAALPIAGVTAVITLLVVLLWRLTLPRAMSVTVTASDITYRRYGRKDTVRRDASTRSAARMLVLNTGVRAPYLVVAGDSGNFLLNTDMWADDDLLDIAAAIPEANQDPDIAVVDAKQMETEFPGVLPAYTAHPNRTALLTLAALIPITVAGMWLLGTLTDDSDDLGNDSDDTSQSTVRGELTDAEARRQNRLQDQVQDVVAPDRTWSDGGARLGECGEGAWQRLLEWSTQSTDTLLDARMNAAVDDLATQAGMVATMDQTSATVHTLAFQDDDTGAFLRVQGDGQTATVTTGSACVEPR